MFEELILLVLAVICLAFLILYRAYAELKKEFNDVIFRKHSLSTKYGRMTEQFMPFMDLYPYDSQGFRFIGSPVDGVQFNSDGIVFIEFKTASSRMKPGQQLVKQQVESGRVRFKEIRMQEPNRR